MDTTRFSDEHLPSATVIGTCASDEAAQAAALAVASLADEAYAYRRLVFALLAEGSADRLAALQAALRTHAPDILLEYSDEERAVTLFGRCRAPDGETAMTLADRLTAYFNTPYYLNVHAPWEHDDLPPEEVTRDARVQTTLDAVNSGWQTMIGDLARQFGDEMLDPQNLFDPAQLQAFNEQFQAAQAAMYAQFTAEPADDLDPVTLAALETLRNAFVRLTPEADADDGLSASLNDIQQVTAQYRPTLRSGITGNVATAGRTLTLDFVMFHRTAFGLPALVDYLAAQGCSDFDLRLEDFDDVRGD